MSVPCVLCSVAQLCPALPLSGLEPHQAPLSMVYIPFAISILPKWLEQALHLPVQSFFSGGLIVTTSLNSELSSD